MVNIIVWTDQKLRHIYIRPIIIRTAFFHQFYINPLFFFHPFPFAPIQLSHVKHKIELKLMFYLDLYTCGGADHTSNFQESVDMASLSEIQQVC